MNLEFIENIRSSRLMIVCLICLELWILSYGQFYANSIVLPGLFVTIGCCICLIKPKIGQSSSAAIPSITMYAFLLILVAYLIHRSPMVFELIPIDYKIADMLPVMEVMSERFWSGEDIYAIIPEIWGGMEPIYLPAMWLPLTPASFLSIDIRWIGVLGMIGVPLLALSFSKNRIGISSFFILAIPLAIFLIWHFRFQLNIVTMTNEGAVFFYFMLLCFAIARNYPILIGLSLALCMMSRYIIAPWAIMICIAYLIYESRRFSIQLLVSGAVSSILLLTVGQAWGRVQRFIGLSSHYLDALMAEEYKYSPLIDESLSLTRYFNYSAIPQVHLMLTVCSVAAPILCFIYFWRKRETIDFRKFALVSMKISMIVFFAFLTMPYHYIFYSSFIVSIALVAYTLSRSDRGALVGNH